MLVELAVTLQHTIKSIGFFCMHYENKKHNDKK